MNRLLCFFCALTLQQAAAASPPYPVSEPPPGPLVRVVLDSDFRPEAEFRIAEALRRPPLDWSMIHPHPAENDPQMVMDPNLTENILAAWDQLWRSNPLYGEDVDSVAQHCQDILTDLACSQALAEERLASNAGLRVDTLDFRQLPKIHTGEDFIVEHSPQTAAFPLDPYGYDEYNQYFEPEVYDWFVFITDDLSVVYVHEVSDVAPATRHVAESLDTPPFDLEMAAEISAELAARNSVPEAFQVFVRTQVTKIVSGKIQWRTLVEKASAQTRAVSQPIWERYVRHSDLFHSYRVADLPKLLRF